MRIDDCARIRRSLSEVKADSINGVVLIFYVPDLLFELRRYADLYIGCYFKASVFVAYLIFCMRQKLLDYGLEKTYLSIRYSLSPRNESNRNFKGSVYCCSLNL